MRTQNTTTVAGNTTAAHKFVIQDMSDCAKQLNVPQFVYGLNKQHLVMTMTQCINEAKKFATEYAAARFILKHANVGYGFSGTCAIRMINA